MDITNIKNVDESKKIKLLYTGTCIILVICAYFGFLYISKNKIGKGVTQAQNGAVTSSLPKKTVYDNVLPPNFPEAVLLEKNPKLTVSYSKEYENKMYQTSVVISSQKTVVENFPLYEEFYHKNGWKITSSHKDALKSYIYGTKGVDTLEVTIRPTRATTTESQLKMGKSFLIINAYKK